MLKKNFEESKVNMAIESVSRYPSSPAEATEPPKPARISFSVASILADTKANRSSDEETAEMIRHHRSIPESPLRQSPLAQPELPGGNSMSPRPSSQTPPLNLMSANVMSSDDEYENSIVDVGDQNDIQSEDEDVLRGNEKERLGPIRPQPFSALAAAAAYGLGWPGPAPVVPSFGGLFQSHFPGHLTG